MVSLKEVFITFSSFPSSRKTNAYKFEVDLKRDDEDALHVMYHF